VAGLFGGTPPEELTTLGEYGVSFLASERRLEVPDDPFFLRRLLASCQLPGVLVLDTRPILDAATRNALHAADLVLAPVKDRASLVNAAALQAVLDEAEDGGRRLWLVPSLIDGRLRLREGIGMRDFLVFSARERGYQVFAAGIAKSPKVESLATNLTSRVYPILTHARTTRVHAQFKALAEFVLARLEELPRSLARRPLPGTDGARPHLLRGTCPACGGPMPTVGHFFQALHSRTRGFFDRSCLAGLVEGTEAGERLDEGGLLTVLFDTEGDLPVATQLFAADGAEIVQPQGAGSSTERWLELAASLNADAGGGLYRETLLVAARPDPAGNWQDRAWRGRFAALRRRVLDELAGVVR
jgi:hypothetical protein